MPLTPLFQTQHYIGVPSTINIEDVSTGSDGAITSRVVYFRTNTGAYLVPTGTTTDYVVWALADTDEDFVVLDKDYSISITVNWLNVSGTVLYTKTSLVNFSLYNEEFDYSLTSKQASNTRVVSDTAFYQNRMKLRVEIDNAKQAVTLAGNITNGQASNDRATYLRDNETKYF